MKPSLALFAAVTLVMCGSSLRVAPAAEIRFSDSICPGATPYVIAVGKLHKDEPPQVIYDAAQAATDAYARCSKDKLVNGFPEARNYADTRGGQFAWLAAHSLIALNRLEDAQSELQRYRPLVQGVVDWQKIGEDSANEGDRRGSMYRDVAKDIVTAIDADLAQIAQRSRNAAHPPASAASPSP